MKKPTLNTRYTEPADVLDWSYVELQEHDFLESQRQEYFYDINEDTATNLQTSSS